MHFWILISFLFVGFGSYAEEAQEESVICKFHLISRHNPKLRKKYNVKMKEFFPEQGETPKQAFQRMINSGVNCKGLVLSGHYLGGFFSNTNARGDKHKLFLKDIEDMSCDKKNKEWFNKINSLWLMGCNTVKDQFLQINKAKKRTNSNIDSEVARLIAKREVAYEDIGYIQHAYSNTFDEASPLSSRYLRAFPNTQIYGFNNAAPENKGREDEALIERHIEQLTIAIEKDNKHGESYQDNIKTSVDMLLNFNADYCDKKYEAWQERVHPNARAMETQDYSDVYQIGCDLIKQKKIIEESNRILENSNNDEKIKLARRNKRKAQNKIIETLKMIDEKDQGIDVKNKYSHLLFQTIYETWLFSKRTGDSNFKGRLESTFKEGKSFKSALETRIESPFGGTIRKIDILKFHTDVFGKTEYTKQQVQNILDNKIHPAFKHLVNVRRTSADKDQRSLYLQNNAGKKLSWTAGQQLAEYDLLTDEQRESLLNNRTLLPKGTGNTYALQMKFQLQDSEKTVNDTDNTLKWIRKRHNEKLKAAENQQTKEALWIKQNQEESRYLTLAATSIHKKNDPKALVKLLDLTKASDQLDKDSPQELIVMNTVLERLETDYAENPKKQYEVLLNYFYENPKRLMKFVIRGSHQLMDCKDKKHLVSEIKSKAKKDSDLANYINNHQDTVVKVYFENPCSL